jgi:hypothetical protein
MVAVRGEVASVINNLSIPICDCLMVLPRGEAEESVVRQHRNNYHDTAAHGAGSTTRRHGGLGLQ